MAAGTAPPVFDACFRQRMLEAMKTISPTSSLLETVFDDLWERRAKDLNTEDYRAILEDLGVTGDHLRQHGIKGFVRVLQYYVGFFPGWGRKRSVLRNLNGPNVSDKNDEELEEDPKKTLYREFYAYLYLKIKDVLDSDWLISCETEITSCNSEDFEDVQPSTSFGKPCIVIEGPPKYLKSIAFTSSGDDIIIKKQEVIPWDSSKLTLKQLLNCPYVEVNVNLGDVSFSRSNVHEFNRYISSLDNPEPEDHYEFEASTSKIDKELPCSVYHHIFFKSYFDQFLKMLEAVRSLTQGRKSEISIIIGEFLSDIEEINMNNIVVGSNISTCFTIGNAKYSRSQDMEGVTYVEILTPQVLLSLRHCKAVLDKRDKKEVTFKSLNALKKSPRQVLKLINSGSISYSCNLCNKEYSSFEVIRHHFNQEHGLEGDVACSECGEIVDIFSLAGSRWVHDCKK